MKLTEELYLAIERAAKCRNESVNGEMFATSGGTLESSNGTFYAASGWHLDSSGFATLGR